MTPPTDARAPKRQRGRLRVAAILATGAEVFREKGYDAATMTEIAARSKTAIGSLYRFFPAKEALADALLLQFVERNLSCLAALAERAEGLSGLDLADAFVDFSLGLQAERHFAIALVDASSGSEGKRLQFRNALRQGVAAILMKSIAELSKERAAVMAALILHVLKALASDAPAPNPAQVGEIRMLLRSYLAMREVS